MKWVTFAGMLCLSLAAATRGAEQFTDIGAGLTDVRMCSLAWGDYDDDGDLDLALAGHDSGGSAVSKVYRNDAGMFLDTGAALTGVVYCSLAWGDYDNDGDLDLVVGGGGSSKVYRNDGGTFTDIVAGLTGVEYCSLAWGDYDNDGDLDLALAGRDSGNNKTSKVYRNNTGAFTDVGAGLTGAEGCFLVWGDYDNDGDLDLALAGWTDVEGYVSKVYRNDGGTLTDIAAGLDGVGMDPSLAWGDYDNDGDLDLALAGYDASSYISRIYRNDAGTFTDIGAGLTGVRSCSLAWGDYDNDGDLDLALAGTPDGSNGTSKIYRNDAGTFTDIGAGLTGVRSCSLAWGDYDNDGDLDLALAGWTGTVRVSKVYRNNGGVFNTPPSAPTGLSSSVTGNRVTFSWTASTDPETPQAALTYNLRVGTAPGAGDIVSPMADLASGLRHVPALGSTQENTSWTLSLPAVTSYWSVQAIDTTFAGSAWAAEQSIFVPLAVASPNGGEVWPVGSSQEIAWTASGVANVKIELSRDGGATWEDIVASTAAAAGTYPWTVTGPASANCVVRVSDATDGSPSDDSDAAFTIREQMTLTLSLSAAVEGDGTLSGAGTVSIPTALASPLTVTLVSDDTTEATVPASVIIPAGLTSIDFDVTIVDDTEIDGDQTVTISASATAYVSGNGSMLVNDNEMQTITVTLPASATEGDGTLTDAGTVSIPGTWTTNLVIDLASDDTTELDVPLTVTILQGDTSASFDLTVPDDALIDGTKTVPVTPTLAGWTCVADSMDVLDNETQTVTVTLPATATEGDGALVGQGTVTIPAICEWEVVIDLLSDDETELTVPATVTILQGNTSATFDLTVETDGSHDGVQTVSVVASSTGWTSDSTTIDILDVDPATPFDGGCSPTGSGASPIALLLPLGMLVFLKRRRRTRTFG